MVRMEKVSHHALDGKGIRYGNAVFVLLSVCAVFAAWGILRMCADAVVVPVFCRIPAEVASRYYNAPLQKPELLFSAHGMDFKVARSCAATDFCSMVTGLLTYLCLRRRSALLALAALPLAWGITLTANTIRLIFLVPATAWMYNHLPEKTYSACHQAIGTVVFLTGFILLWEGVRHVTRNTSR